MTAVPAIPPINEASKLAAGNASLQPTQPSPALAHKFEALMKRSEDPQHEAHVTGSNSFGNALKEEQNQISATDAATEDLVARLPDMTSQEAFAATQVVSEQMMVMSTRVQVSTSIVESSKGSLDSLLKNQ